MDVLSLLREEGSGSGIRVNRFDDDNDDVRNESDSDDKEIQDPHKTETQPTLRVSVLLFYCQKKESKSFSFFSLQQLQPSA